MVGTHQIRTNHFGNKRVGQQEPLGNLVAHRLEQRGRIRLSNVGEAKRAAARRLRILEERRGIVGTVDSRSYAK